MVIVIEYSIKTKGHRLSFTDVRVETDANGHEAVRFTASVDSWGFSGSLDFRADIASFCAFIVQLKELHDKPRNQAYLWGAYEEQFIRFRPDQLNYTEVHGKLIRYYPKNSVEFEFLVDQAEMDRLVEALCGDFEQYLSRPSLSSATDEGGTI